MRLALHRVLCLAGPSLEEYRALNMQIFAQTLVYLRLAFHKSDTLVTRCMSQQDQNLDNSQQSFIAASAMI